VTKLLTRMPMILP